jgi:hypothetical protein
MSVGSKRTINRHVMGANAHDAAVRIADHHLSGAQVFPGRWEQPDAEGRRVTSFAVAGYGLRLWIRET